MAAMGWLVQAVPWMIMTVGGAGTALAIFVLERGLSLVSLAMAVAGVFLLFRDYRQRAIWNGSSRRRPR